MSRHRFADLVTLPRTARLAGRDSVLASLRGVAAWLDAARESTGIPGKCHRNILYHEGGQVSWMYPNSNTGELLSAWLDLGESLGDARFVRLAADYGATLLADGEKGLYRGERSEAHGLAWYWTDGGTYTGGYSMRMPAHFHRLYRATGDARFLDACDWIGRTLLARSLDNGLVTAAWNPADGWMPEPRIGSRYIYPVATFSTLWKIIGDEAYRVAYERVIETVLSLQNPDGSFFQCIDPVTTRPVDRSVKFHFYAYIFNALEQAHAVTGDERLVACAVRLADHLAGVFYYRHAVPYCAGEVASPADQTEADSAMQDSCAGLLWLSSVTGEEVYRDIATKLWLDAYLHQLPADAPVGWAGALLRGLNPSLQSTLDGVPANRRHLHHDPRAIARCDLWCVVNHVFACRRLLQIAPDNLPDSKSI